MTGSALRENASLIAHHDRLLFERAYPTDARALGLTERELRRISSFLRTRHGTKRSNHAAIDGSEGLPFISAVSRYSHDCVRWLLAHPHCTVALEEFAEPTLDLNAVLRLTLPRAERSETNAELTNDELFACLLPNVAEKREMLARMKSVRTTLNGIVNGNEKRPDDETRSNEQTNRALDAIDADILAMENEIAVAELAKKASELGLTVTREENFVDAPSMQGEKLLVAA